MAMNESELPLVFASYASEDRQIVTRYRDDLVARGINVWIDHVNIKPGQQWEFEIDKAISKAKIILIFLSKNSVIKRGFVQREIRKALYNSQARLRSDIYIIPVVLDDDVEFPDDLSHIHYVKASSPTCLDDLDRSIREQLEALGEQVAKAQEKSDIHWVVNTVVETWDGLPGYRAQLQVPIFRSDVYNHIHQISDIIRGHYAISLSSLRQVKFHQELDRYNFGYPKWAREHLLDVNFDGVSIKGRIVSVKFSVHTFTGGAHGYTEPQIFNFLADPLIAIQTLESLFVDKSTALEKIQGKIRNILQGNIDHNSIEARESLISPHPSIDSILSGTENWQSFKVFEFTENGILVYFPPYQCDCYAVGTLTALLDYKWIDPMLHRHIQGGMSI
jgi:hypothetical protein